MFFMKAYAEPTSGEAGYRRAVARQYANQYGVSTRRATRALASMGGQSNAFAGVGRRASRRNVLAAAQRAANR